MSVLFSESRMMPIAHRRDVDCFVLYVHVKVSSGGASWSSVPVLKRGAFRKSSKSNVRQAESTGWPVEGIFFGFALLLLMQYGRLSILLSTEAT